METSILGGGDTADGRRGGWRAALSQSLSSIRTRYSLFTAFLLIAALVIFYIGGRIVLVRLIHDSEESHTPVVRIAERQEPFEFSIVPMMNGALEFYSGGHWLIDRRHAPKTIPARAAKMAFERLVMFIAIGGMVFVLIAFLCQGKVLLNPLTRMTKALAEIGEHNADTDCPRLEWKGKDEFAQLAVSVNRMLETISRRSLAVAQMEARHHALIRGLPDSLAIFDRAGKLVSISKEAEGVDPMPGLAVGEGPSESVFGTAQVERFNAEFEKTASTGEIGRLRIVVATGSGAQRNRHFEVRLTKMDEHFVLAIARDVTVEFEEHRLRLAAEERAQDSRKRESLTLLAAGISHDMNNVLSVVLSAAESAEADPSGDSKNALDTIRDAVRRGSSMMSELSTFAGDSRMTLLKVSPVLVLDDVKLLANGAVGRNIALNYHCDADLPPVDVDLHQFWKVPFNIIKNSAEAMSGRPGHIDVSVSRFSMTPRESIAFSSTAPLLPGVGILIAIEDDGPGIPPAMVKRLFDPFVSSKAVGRGLGLAIVRTIVEAHGGGIRVKSVVNKGTRFEIYLPESSSPAAVADVESQKSENAAARASGGEVLVVDDDRLVLRSTSMLLKLMGLSAHTADCASAALAVARRRASALRAILLDVNLGGMDTVRLAASLRASAPGVPIVVSSGSAEEHVRKIFADVKYDRFLAKPYTLEELRRNLLQV